MISLCRKYAFSFNMRHVYNNEFDTTLKIVRIFMSAIEKIVSLILSRQWNKQMNVNFACFWSRVFLIGSFDCRTDSRGVASEVAAGPNFSFVNRVSGRRNEAEPGSGPNGGRDAFN